MSNLSIYFTISNVDASKEYLIRRNIKKNILFPRYKGSFGGLDAPLSYVGSKEINPLSNINITNLEDSIPENSRFSFEGIYQWSGNIGYVTAKYFILTDVVGDYSSIENEPFFYKHVLPSSSIQPDSVFILDKNLQTIDENLYKVERIQARDSSDIPISGSYEDCSVYFNFRNSYSINTNELELFYVRYEIQGTSHYDLLNPVSAFSEATVSDISTVTGELKSWRKVYLLDTSSTPYTVITPDVGKNYYLQPLSSSRITIKEPIDRDDNSPWFLKVTNGSFSALRNSQVYDYSIPEFSSQSFSPLYPYKLEVDEKAERIDSDIIQVDRTNLKIDNSLYSMDVLVKDSSDNVLYAFTTSTSKNGQFYRENGERVYRTVETDNAWVQWSSSGIVSWDEMDGFIHLNKRYPDTYYFYVSYYYEETGYEITSLNVNPIFDDNYNGEFYVVYTVPQGGVNDNASQTQSVFYIKVDSSGRIIETSQDSSGGNYDLDSNLTDESQYMYYSKSANSTSTVAQSIGQTYIQLPSTSEWPSQGIVCWFNKYNIPQIRAYNNVTSKRLYFENAGNPLAGNIDAGTVFYLYSFKTIFSSYSSINQYQWLILGEIGASSTSRVQDLAILDIRKNGGFIREKYWKDSEEIDPRALWARPYIEMGRGQPVPGESASVVKIPFTLLSEYGGSFSRKDIEAIVTRRHLATGVLPVILYHGAIPEISSITSSTSSITVCWSSEGTGYDYKIYYSATDDGPWTLAGTLDESNGVYSTCYTISGLPSGVIYYVGITSIDSNGIESPMGVPWGIQIRG